MLNLLQASWRARRVLLFGGPDPLGLYTQALLRILGARPARLASDATSATLYRALSDGRISAVIVPAAHALAAADDFHAQLHALERLLIEVRESGVPLVLLCSHEDVFLPLERPADETSPLGGRTQPGLYQAMLQLAADGYARGLFGDPVATLICRHPPCLGDTHPSVAQYSAWCHALLAGDSPVVFHPQRQGTFFHPLDAALGILSLGAQALSGNPVPPGAYHIVPAPFNQCANRSACLRLMQREGGVRAVREIHPPEEAPVTPLGGTRLRHLCACSPLLNAEQALSFLMEQERAAAVSPAAAQLLRDRQAQQLLKLL